MRANKNLLQYLTVDKGKIIARPRDRREAERLKKRKKNGADGGE